MDTYNLLKTAMDVSQTRSELISNNIANVNTPNYKAKRVVFESQLSQAMDNLNPLHHIPQYWISKERK